jgi:uncharacterized protein
MPGMYSAPGVYVEEIPKFPPSIAPVETAIPAFIGYTEKAERNGESLNLKPTRIESIAEYEALFGGGPSQDVEIYLDGNNNFVQGIGKNALYLYDGLRLFYANGGGKCYIVSVGKYSDTVSNTNIENGLAELEKEDEPTIILLPDAAGFSTGALYTLQQKALAQCAKLMDRVTVCDLEKSVDTTVFKTKADSFKNGIGINDLKYGAAYGPWVNAALPRRVWLRNLSLNRFGPNSPILLESLTSDAKILDLIADTRLAETTEKSVKATEGTLSDGPGKKLEDALTAALDNWRTQVITPGTPTKANVQAALKQFIDLTMAILNEVQALNIAAAAFPVGTKFELAKAISDYLGSLSLKDYVKRLAAHSKVAAPNDMIVITPGNNFNNSAVLFDYSGGADLLADPNLPNVVSEYASATDAKSRGIVAFGAAYSALSEAIACFKSIHGSIQNFEKTLNDALLAAFGKFKELTEKGAEALNLVPPSGAIAGIYAKVDNERGVWKAPANVSLSAVNGPAVRISHEQQGEYNVDVNAGKSINIIRSFTGKGTLVWGARTLAGNDSEWRYISVRRFFNYVEESVKKATEQFVFEPNDANTWVRVQAMIENFLTTLWRQGALQGVKPEHAFYVAVGLGKTMTPLDILEGRMIIEIGMAAVRPAEFIILKFSHKMAES